MANAPINGATSGTGAQNPPGPGSLFGVPKYSTQRRFVPDNGNNTLGVAQNQGAQQIIPTTRLDQLDIVIGEKLYLDLADTWTQGAPPDLLTVSPWYPSNLVQQITFKLQAAYNTFNLTGPLAAIIQSYRPMWGNRGLSSVRSDPFAKPANSTPPSVIGAPTSIPLAIDIPFAFKFDEYYDLNAQGDPTRKLYDSVVSPMFMAAQARVVVPTIVMSPGITTLDLLGGAVSKLAADATSTFTGSGSLTIQRDSYWTASNPAGNPPQYPWLYTRDYFTQPTNGQGRVGVLIQNTGVSVGQVLSLFGFIWDPALVTAGSPFGGVVPMSSIETFELVTGGTLQNDFETPEMLTDRMRAQYANTPTDFPSGVFIFDRALSEDGSYISNANAINTYLVNGVQLNITFKAGHIPSSSSTVYMGVEALKLATS
jgi:hypothetical protein